MCWARKPYLLRIAAGILMASMLPALFVLPSSAAPGATYGTYSRWVRAQLRVPADASIEAALSRASEERPASLEAFIKAFLNAYEEANPVKSAAFAFTGDDLSDDALVTYLQRRYTRVGDEGVLPRVYLSAAAGATAALASGDSGAIAGGKATPLSHEYGRDAILSEEAEFVIPLRTLSAANPLGP